MKKLTYNNTPETLSLNEAVEYFKPDEKGLYHSSYDLFANGTIPKEYLDNEDFFRKIIPTRITTIDPPIISYASHKIKANRELALMSFLVNGTLNGLYVDDYYKYRLPLSEEQKKELKDNKQYIIIEKLPDRLVVKSKLLEDKTFIDMVVKKLQAGDMPRNSRYLIHQLVEYSEVFKSDEKYMKWAISQDPTLLARYTGENKTLMIQTAVQTMLESGDFRLFWDENMAKQQPKSVQKLLKMCKKIRELPNNARLRTLIYKRICNRYLESVEQEMAQENTVV